MQITHKIALDLARRGQTPVIPVVQGDQNTRQVCVALADDGEPFTVPEDAAVSIRYRRSDGTGGVYDTLSDGSAAWSIGEHDITLVLAPELLCLPGLTVVAAALSREEEVLGTFSFHVAVAEDPSADIPEGERYIQLGTTLEQMKAYVDEKLAEVQGLLTTETITAGEEPAEETVSVMALTLDYTGVTLEAGDHIRLACSVEPANATNTAVTWETSDSGVATVTQGVVVAVGAGSCTITARSAENPAITAVCAVTVPETETVFYTVTYELTNVTSDNAAVSAEAGSAYSAALTAAEGYTLGEVTVTMGGTDISASAVSGGTVSVDAVTGDLVITAAGEISADGGTVKVQLASLELTQGITKKDGSLNTGITTGYTAQIPYFEGMQISTGMNANWTANYPPFLVLDSGSYVVPEYSTGSQFSLAGLAAPTEYTCVLSGYGDSAEVYVNLYTETAAAEQIEAADKYWYSYES